MSPSLPQVFLTFRSGYTTRMEPTKLGLPALLVHTVGQSDQAYLADRLERLEEMHGVRLADLDLPRGGGHRSCA